MNVGKNKMSIYANALGLASMLVPTMIYLSDISTETNGPGRLVAAVSSSLFSIFMLVYWIVRNWCVNLSSCGSKQYFFYLTLIVLCTAGLATCVGETFLYGLHDDGVDVLKMFATFSSISYLRFKCLGLLPRPVYRSSGVGNAVSIASIIMVVCAIAINAKTNDMLVVSWSFVLSGVVLASISLAEEILLSRERDIWDVSKNQLRSFDIVQLILFSLAYYWPDRSRF
ncbi:hypothetical protein [Encephalitozoon cuniculi GB-M1]|uniref:Uncharacterized protein n=1 Tax=Encephalitozoon cuniculi (strain GB-M1) TaxID=284813 RepID=Q8STY6_ENCCU|nr:uncharacterized protein ECU09_0040 [Encephalitozoon cuniculi GB-M1]CAD26975.1 hypothetical protein [Encephalitozoon cuniculi GB-M1]